MCVVQRKGRQGSTGNCLLHQPGSPGSPGRKNAMTNHKWHASGPTASPGGALASSIIGQFALASAFPHDFPFPFSKFLPIETEVPKTRLVVPSTMGTTRLDLTKELTVLPSHAKHENGSIHSRPAPMRAEWRGRRVLRLRLRARSLLDPSRCLLFGVVVWGL
jgi:hypothetical protein